MFVFSNVFLFFVAFLVMKVLLSSISTHFGTANVVFAFMREQNSNVVAYVLLSNEYKLGFSTKFLVFLCFIFCVQISTELPLFVRYDLRKFTKHMVFMVRTRAYMILKFISRVKCYLGLGLFDCF